MDHRILALGAELTVCPFRDQCPGILGRTVTFDPILAVVPRGFLVTPEDAQPSDIRLAIVGQNPGRWDGFHRRAILERIAGRTPEDAFEGINGFFNVTMPTYHYNRRLESVIAAVMGDHSADPRLYLEVAYCETARGVSHPGGPTMAFCAERHLSRHLALVPPGCFVMCVGAPARDWFRNSPYASTVRWFSVPHPAAWGEFARLVDPSTRKLRVGPATLWANLVARRANGVHLA